MFLTNSTVTGNSTSGSLGEGGGIYNSTALTLTNSTVSENSVEGIGGGIYNNSWNKATLFSSIISGNQASDGGNEVYNYQSSNIVADSYNLFGHSGENNAEAFYGFIPGSSDVNATNGGIDGILIPTAQSAILHPLGDNGGPTMTHTLVPGSPALDLDASCSALQEAGKELLDQRGESRPVGNGCDAGSFELSISPQDTRAFLPAIYSLLL